MAAHTCILQQTGLVRVSDLFGNMLRIGNIDPVYNIGQKSRAAQLQHKLEVT